MGSSSAVEVQVPHKRILSLSFCMQFYKRGGEKKIKKNQYLLGTPAMD